MVTGWRFPEAEMPPVSLLCWAAARKMVAREEAASTSSEQKLPTGGDSESDA